MGPRNQIRRLPAADPSEQGKVTVYTRNGHDWIRFPLIADAFDIPVERAIFDDELVVVHDGRTNFSELQADLAALPRSTSASMKGKIWSTWARSAPAGPEQSPARSGNSSKRWSARNPSSRNQSANLRPPRLSRRSLPTLSIGTLRRKGCFAKARLKVSSGTENAHRRFYIRRPDLQFGRQRRAVCLRSMEQGPRASRF
jgi:hypothetical protein